MALDKTVVDRMASWQNNNAPLKHKFSSEFWQNGKDKYRNIHLKFNTFFGENG